LLKNIFDKSIRKVYNMKNELNKNNKKIVGILGGMGPYSTIMFMKNVLDLTDAKKDSDYIRTVVDSNTCIPSRSRAILYNETSPLEGMVEACQKLQKYPVDIVVVPNNSACHWVHEVQKKVKVPIINIANVTVKQLLEKKNINKVTALGSMAVYQTDLYKKEINKCGTKYIKISEDKQKQNIDFIEKIKLGNNSEELNTMFNNFVEEIVNEYKLDGIILACTEFTRFKDLSYSVSVIDSGFALAQFVVDYAIHDKPIELDTAAIKDFWKERAAQLKDGKIEILQSTMLTATESDSAKLDRDDNENIMKHIRPLLESEGTLLDIGCGNGKWSRRLAQYVKEIDACDYCEDFISIAKGITTQAGITNVNYFCASAENLGLNKTYDYVLVVGVLHYLNDEIYEKVINKIRKIVKAGGYVIFREPFGVSKRFELHGLYSETLNTEYNAIYRTSNYMIDKFGKDFKVICDVITLEPTKDKPETYRKIIVLKKQ